jgi:Zn-dependent protease
LGKFSKMAQVMRVDGVNVYVHWSVFAIAAIFLIGAIERPAVTFAALACYFLILLIHECGHMIVARRRGCQVEYIEIYPIHGRTCFTTPWSRYDHCLIAWGGVIAQLVVAIPLIAWTAVIGYTPFEPLNAVLAILGGFSLGVAAFNLLPVAPLDGSIAWGLFPELIKRYRNRRAKRQAAGWR